MLLAIMIAIAVLLVIASLGMADATIKGPPDAGLALQAAAVTKTATFNGTAIDMGSGFAPGGGGIHAQASFPVTAADFTSGDETYTFKLQHSDDNSTFVDAGAAFSALAATVGGSVVAMGTISKRYVRYALTVGGTTPSITYGPAYLVTR